VPIVGGQSARQLPNSYRNAVWQVDKANYIHGYILYEDMLQDFMNSYRAKIGN
jgi:hypothetical protein